MNIFRQSYKNQVLKRKIWLMIQVFNDAKVSNVKSQMSNVKFRMTPEC